MNSHPFHKLQGAGNDFVALDQIESALPDAFDFALASQTLCERHRGVGGDGLLTLSRSTIADFKMRMWNPDGTEDMCGNGLRCIAALIWRQKYNRHNQFSVETLAGIRRVQVVTDEIFTINMGLPLFAPKEIPTKITTPQNFELALEDRVFPATSLSTGSTHTVIWCDDLPGTDEFQNFSSKIELHSAFPERTSVMWTKRAAPNRFKIRIWERGAGETLACGTGACAVGVAAAIRFGETGEKLEIESAGGTLQVQWKGPDEEIFLTGPAQHVFHGVWSF